MNPFDAWADLYDAVHSNLTEDISLYVEEARRSGGPVLELGCGTGRIAIPIAQAGMDITGLDSSEALLEVARRKAAELQPADRDRLTLVNADMRNFSLERRFRAIIIPFNTFLSLLTVDEQVSTLKNVRAHLEPAGKLVFDVFVPDLDMLVDAGDLPYHLRDVTDPATGRRFVLYHQSRYDNFNQIIRTRLIIEELDYRGAVSQKVYRDYRLRYAHRWEMQHLLTHCGFEVVSLYGDFDRSPSDESSTEMIWVCRPA